MTNKQNSKYSNSVLDSVVAVNEIVLGSAASTAMAAMYISMAQSTGISNQNTVSTQHQRNILGTAAIAAGTGNLLWSGLTEQVGEMSVAERMKGWQDMIAISEGREVKAEPSAEEKEASPSSEGQ